MNEMYLESDDEIIQVPPIEDVSEDDMPDTDAEVDSDEETSDEPKIDEAEEVVDETVQ